ncbi:MAG: zinc ribbon domain-containing protein, partial [Thermoplasmata archaeon]
IPKTEFRSEDIAFKSGKYMEVIFTFEEQNGYPINFWFVNDDNYLLLQGGAQFLYFIDGSGERLSYAKRIVLLEEYNDYKLVMANYFVNASVTLKVNFELRTYEDEEEEHDILLYSLSVIILVLVVVIVISIFKIRRLKHAEAEALEAKASKDKRGKGKRAKDRAKEKKKEKPKPKEKPKKVKRERPKDKKPEEKAKKVEKEEIDFCGYCGKPVDTPFCKNCGREV